MPLLMSVCLTAPSSSPAAPTDWHWGVQTCPQQTWGTCPYRETPQDATTRGGASDRTHTVLIIVYLWMHLCNQYCAFVCDGTKITTRHNELRQSDRYKVKSGKVQKKCKKKNCWHAVSLTLYWTIVELQRLIDQWLPLFDKTNKPPTVY